MRYGAATLTVAVRVHPLRAGTLRAFPAWFAGEKGTLNLIKSFRSGFVTAPVQAFALEHPERGTILVDTGLDPLVARDLPAAFGRLNALVFKGMKLSPEGTIAEQLARRGLAPPRTIVMTHLHVDHASGLKQFPGAEVVVTRREWEAAQEQGPRHGYHLPQLEADVTWRRLDDFATEHDLLGDGAIRLLWTPGHTLGHVSLLVRTASCPVLIAGDAIYTRENLTPGREPLRCEDRGAWRRSVETLRAHSDALVIPGHDEAAWTALEPVY